MVDSPPAMKGEVVSLLVLLALLYHTGRLNGPKLPVLASLGKGGCVGIAGRSHRQAGCSNPPPMPMSVPTSAVPNPPATAMFIIRRFADLFLASNGPGAQLT